MITAILVHIFAAVITYTVVRYGGWYLVKKYLLKKK